MPENSVSNQFSEDDNRKKRQLDLGTIMDAAIETFEKLSPEQQQDFLQQAEESRVRHERQKIADMQSQFHVDHGLSTSQAYRRSAGNGDAFIRVLIVDADGARHNLQGQQCFVEANAEEECFTKWPETLFIVNEDGSREEINRLGD